MLSIAGSDSGGGAGVQADLKAFARCGVHGMTAITAITAQSTTGVRAIHAVPAAIVRAQIDAVLADIGADAVKVGMLGSAEVTLAVARALRELPAGTPVVVDPVMVAESGARLLEADAQRALVEEILPLATVLTPNVPEARVLAGSRVGCWESAELRSDGAARRSSGALRCWRAGRGSWSSRAATGRARSTCSSSRPGARRRSRFPASATATVRRTARAARTRACSRRSSRWAARRCRRPARARRLAGEAVARGLRDIGAGAGPVDVLGLGVLRGAIIEER